jgi:hypothetical protein
MNPVPSISIFKTRGKKRHYTLDMGAHGQATLQYESLFCKNAVGRINDQEWKFVRKGLWKKELEIVAQQSPYTKIHVKLGWRQKLTLRAPDNNSYTFKCAGFLRRRWVWLDARGQQLMEIKSRPLSRKRCGMVTQHAPWTPTLSWLLLVGWFQLVIWEEQTIGAAAAA